MQEHPWLELYLSNMYSSPNRAHNWFELHYEHFIWNMEVSHENKYDYSLCSTPVSYIWHHSTKFGCYCDQWIMDFRLVSYIMSCVTLFHGGDVRSLL